MKWENRIQYLFQERIQILYYVALQICCHIHSIIFSLSWNAAEDPSGFCHTWLMWELQIWLLANSPEFFLRLLANIRHSLLYTTLKHRCLTSTYQQTWNTRAENIPVIHTTLKRRKTALSFQMKIKMTLNWENFLVITSSTSL